MSDDECQDEGNTLAEGTGVCEPQGVIAVGRKNDQEPVCFNASARSKTCSRFLTDDARRQIILYDDFLGEAWLASNAVYGIKW